MYSINSLLTSIYIHENLQNEPFCGLLLSKFPKIYDRGFCGYSVPFLHQLYGSNCIIRLTRTFNPIVVDFIQSSKRQLRVSAPMTERATRSLRKLGYKVSRKGFMKYRLIRVDLPNGEVEILLTTLLNTRTWPANQFKT